MEDRERQNSQKWEISLMHVVRSNQVLGALLTHQRGSKIAYDLRVTYVQIRPTRLSKVRVATLRDVLNVVTEARHWIDQEAGSTVSLTLTMFNVI